MKKDHSKCCDRFRIFPLHKATYLTDSSNEWKETTIYPDHIRGVYDSVDECIDQVRELNE